MKTLLALTILIATLPGTRGEELTFRGEVVEVDLEGSLLVVKARTADGWIERLFEVDERTTEVYDSEAAHSGRRDEPTRIALSDLEAGDHVEVRYEVVKGRNVATLIERNRASHA